MIFGRTGPLGQLTALYVITLPRNSSGWEQLKACLAHETRGHAMGVLCVHVRKHSATAQQARRVSHIVTQNAGVAHAS